MTFSTTCKRCQKVIEFLDVQAGTKYRCPRCNKRMVLEANPVSWLKWLVIPLCFIGLVAVVLVILLLVEPGFQDSTKDNLNLIKKFFTGSGPPKQ